MYGLHASGEHVAARMVVGRSFADMACRCTGLALRIPRHLSVFRQEETEEVNQLHSEQSTVTVMLRVKIYGDLGQYFMIFSK